MHKQPLAQHIEETQRQIAHLRQHLISSYPEQRDDISQLCASMAQTLERLSRIDTPAGANGHSPDAARSTVTAQHQATPASWINDQLLVTRTITDNATACLFMMDVEGRCTYMNPAAEQVTGYTFAEIDGQILHDMIHHTRPDGTPFPITECPIGCALMQHQRVRAHADLFVRKDGSFFPVICAASPIIRDGALDGMVLEIRDMTEHRQAQDERDRLFTAEQRAVAQAQHHAEQLRGLTAASIAINGVLSVNEVLQLITEQARQMIGAHQAVSSLSINDDWAQAITTISLSDKYRDWHSYEAAPTGSGIYAEVCRANIPMRLTQAELEAHPSWRGFSDHHGTHPPLRGWLAAPFIGRDGRNIGLLQLSDKYDGDFTGEDEAVVIQLAQMASGALENARLYTAAQEAIRARNEFLSVASHELNTPITSLRGYAQLLSRQLAKGQVIDPDRAIKALKAIEQQSIKLSQLISQLLDISRIESQRLILNCQPSDLTRLILDVAANLQATTTKHDLIVQASGPVIVDVDPLRLEQVLTNLIGNAIKYSPEGGPVDIEIAQPSSESIELSVTDYGIGIPPEHRPHIFDRFYQAHGSGYFGGMGLGLSISQQIVVLHGGELRAEFPPEGGTRFVIRLPRQR